MKTLQSFPLCLLLLCYLCLTTSKDTNFDQAFNHLLYLDTTYFQGPWQSAAQEPVALFKNNYGYFASKANKDCKLPVSSIVTIYDGNNMQEFLEVNLCQPFSASFHFDPANASIIGTNVALNISNRVCRSDISIHFINQASNTPMTSLSYLDKWEDTRLGIQLIISSSDCSIFVTTDVVPGYDKVNSETIYSFFYLVLSIFGAINLIDFKHSDQISVSSQSLRCAWAIFFFIYNINLCFPGGSPICYLSVAAGIGEILCTLYLSLVDYETRYDRKTIKYLVVLIPCLFISWIIAASYDLPWLFLSAFLYPVPQIIKTYKNGEKAKFEANILNMFLFSQAFVGVFLWQNPQSFFQRIPNPTFFYVYFGLVVTQWLILMRQRNHPSLKQNRVEHFD